MSSIDDLFKSSNTPTGSKRKLEVPDAQQVYKSSKLSRTSSPNGHSNGASVEDVPEDNGDDDDDLEAGPALPPEDEEDDRFFGTGVTRDTADALDYLDNQDPDGETYTDEKIDLAWLRRTAVTFERKVAKNAELRARYESEPQKFMASEADVDDEVKSWSVLAEHPDLYPELASSPALEHLVNLLAHENTDIAISAIEIISELLDEDVNASPPQWDSLVAALLSADLLQLLLSNLTRLSELEESDRTGVYHSLAILESLASQPTTATKIAQPPILLYLCNRIKSPEKTLSQNKQYAAEVLQVLLQASPSIRKIITLDLDAVDLFLQLLAQYRKRDPEKDSLEEEYAENLFDALTCILDEPDGKVKFLEAEGVELCLIMLKEGKFSKLRALRLLDHAVGGRGASAAQVCDKVVEAAGLKTLFSMFMKKTDSATVEHLLGIFAALLRLLPGESAARIRTLAKFDGEKVGKLVLLRREYARRVGVVDEEIRGEREGLEEDDIEERVDEWFSRRLEGGLFCLQTIDTILAWLVAEEPKVAKRILEHVGGAAIRASLGEVLSGSEEDGEDEDTKEMLTTLMEFL